MDLVSAAQKRKRAHVGRAFYGSMKWRLLFVFLTLHASNFFLDQGFSH
ncbi:MAG: hypothetical protein ACI9QQ_000594, partial [Myxococcota bacterium]